ncbi:hypothetical protein TNCV_4579661 [Trichonephila clavipes]|nr:hypothetical protein TNCV_4579661 [Trichonephila clavipes]
MIFFDPLWDLWSLGQFSSKIMLVPLQKLLKTSYVIFRLFHTTDLSPVELGSPKTHAMCHSAHDLESAVQDPWTHLPQDNIKCPIN